VPTLWSVTSPDDLRAYEIQAGAGIPVQLPSGAIYHVLTDEEERYLTDKIKRYLSDNHFVNVSDVQDIDKMITFELLIHRWSSWVAKGRDYYDEDINIKQYAEMVKEYSVEVRQLKKALGVDKSTRDRTRGDDSIASLWSNLQRRAAEFGYKRNDEFVQVITSFQRLKAMVTFHDNCDALERKENACDIEDVLEVLRAEIRKFDEIDEKFKFEKQALWIRSQ
jgi:hypothetical protein